MRRARFIDYYLGALVRSAREDAGLTRKALAAKTGIAHATIATYETAERAMPLSTALALLSGIRPIDEWLAPLSEVIRLDDTSASGSANHCSTSTTQGSINRGAPSDPE